MITDLASWNVNSLRARLPRVLELLAEHRPDVLALQETKCGLDDFPTAELATAGYRCTTHGNGRWAGVGLCLRADLDLGEVRRGLPGEPAPDQARWVEARTGDVRVISVYVPNGQAVGSPAFGDKLAFLQAAAARLAELAGEPLVLLGDLNVAPADIDVYDPEAFVGATHVTTAERAGLDALLATGLRDGYRVLHPDEPGFTWWDYRQGHFHRGLGMRIDLALLSEGLADRLESCQIDRGYRKGQRPSDHAPLLVALH